MPMNGIQRRRHPEIITVSREITMIGAIIGTIDGAGIDAVTGKIREGGRVRLLVGGTESTL